MIFEGGSRAETATTRVLGDWGKNPKTLQLKKKDNYVVIKQKNKGGGGEGVVIIEHTNTQAALNR